MMCFPQSTAPGGAPLKVTQYHFTGWPDHGVPQNGVTLINFIKRVRTAHPYSDSRPLLVHCSAGVGRTGAFIVLDSMLQRMNTEENLNIYEFFKQLRAQRVLMVQTQVIYAKKLKAQNNSHVHQLGFKGSLTPCHYHTLAKIVLSIGSVVHMCL